MTRDGTPIQKLPNPKSGVEINIRYGRDGYEVPEYEAREACIYANYNWREWEELHWYERAVSVAQYRMHHLIEGHVHEKSAADHRRKNPPQLNTAQPASQPRRRR